MSIVYSLIFDIRSNKDSDLGIKKHIPREARRRLVQCFRLIQNRSLRLKEEQPRSRVRDTSLGVINTYHLVIQFPRGPSRRLSLICSGLMSPHMLLIPRKARRRLVLTRFHSLVPLWHPVVWIRCQQPCQCQAGRGCQIILMIQGSMLNCRLRPWKGLDF